MASTNFDTLFDTYLEGNVVTIKVTDKDATPNHVLEKGTPWDVEVEWHVHGVGADSIGGEWKIQLKLESLGKGFEGDVAETTKNYTDVMPAKSSSVHRHWGVKFSDLADPLPADEEGVYRLIILITYKNPTGIPGAMAGAIEGPILTFYKVGP